VGINDERPAQFVTKVRPVRAGGTRAIPCRRPRHPRPRRLGSAGLELDEAEIGGQRRLGRIAGAHPEPGVARARASSTAELRRRRVGAGLVRQAEQRDTPALALRENLLELLEGPSRDGVVAALNGRDDFEGLAVFLAELGDRDESRERAAGESPAGGQVGLGAERLSP